MRALESSKEMLLVWEPLAVTRLAAASTMPLSTRPQMETFTGAFTFSLVTLAEGPMTTGRSKDSSSSRVPMVP